MKGKKNRNKIELRLSTCALVQNRKIENFLGLISPQIICFIEFKSYFLRLSLKPRALNKLINFICI